jgi:hypothetical protein
MISRKTAMAITNAYTSKFTSKGTRYSKERVFEDRLYDFLYEREYAAWFCNASKGKHKVNSLREWFLKIHTGESLVGATPDWPWDKRRALGQRYLYDLARDFILWYEGAKSDIWAKGSYSEVTQELIRVLEMDGFVFRDGSLVQVEMDVLDIDEERGLLARLYDSVSLSRKTEAFEFLKMSEEHYVEEHWADCISNSRKFLELILQEGAASLASMRGVHPPNAARPVEIRNFLEKEGLLEKKERELLDNIYGLLSHTGSHPYMAEKDQARLLRQISLTISQFVLLRLENALGK